MDGMLLKLIPTKTIERMYVEHLMSSVMSVAIADFESCNNYNGDGVTIDRIWYGNCYGDGYGIGGRLRLYALKYGYNYDPVNIVKNKHSPEVYMY